MLCAPRSKQRPQQAAAEAAASRGSSSSTSKQQAAAAAMRGTRAAAGSAARTRSAAKSVRAVGSKPQPPQWHLLRQSVAMATHSISLLLLSPASTSLFSCSCTGRYHLRRAHVARAKSHTLLQANRAFCLQLSTHAVRMLNARAFGACLPRTSLPRQNTERTRPPFAFSLLYFSRELELGLLKILPKC